MDSLCQDSNQTNLYALLSARNSSSLSQFLKLERKKLEPNNPTRGMQGLSGGGREGGASVRGLSGGGRDGGGLTRQPRDSDKPLRCVVEGASPPQPVSLLPPLPPPPAT
jgi:hypothetical protein